MGATALTEHRDRVERWSVVVIGGGPAGAVAAKLMAATGLRTLLVEAKRFPRDKVCGGCLNQRALVLLEQAGFAAAVERCEGLGVDGVELHANGSSLFVPTPPGLAVTRRTFDESLAAAAASSGAVVRYGTRASVLPTISQGSRRLQLTDDSGATTELEADVVIAADGLGSPSLSRLPEFTSRVEDDSHLGVGAVLDGEASQGVPAGRIHMAIGEHGYVGIVRCEQGLLNLAGALSPAAVAGRESLPALVRRTLEDAGLSLPDEVDNVPWRGTRRLTQSASRLASRRLFVVGDSAGYVEPFTGEGMAAAIEDAVAVAPFAQRAAAAWDDTIAAQWQAEQAARRRIRQRDCRRLVWLLRRPWATRLGMRLAAAWPTLGERIAQRVSASRTSNRRGVA